ncbi:hypothetical protein [Faecalibacter macacae]|uniref:Uncharacterized protein n=1 Tax=Faecalibacter macacae TaxID=1859289 RepID=A0A3L9M270_9FLAO|nr:hypothetical protein [Faecalibacter macacae]RLZ07115.1 hypothetical protein EAH69_11735 [Faecalibacter macacae]
MKKTFSFLLLFIIIIAQAQSITPKNNIIFNEDFGESEIREVSQYVPQSGLDLLLSGQFSHGSKFYRFAKITKTVDEEFKSLSIDDGYYAVTKPQRIYKYVESVFPKVNFPHKWWLTLDGEYTVPYYNQPPRYNGDDYKQGNVLVVNGGMVLNQYYRRGVQLERGKTYELSADFYALDTSFGIHFEAQSLTTEKVLGKTTKALTLQNIRTWENKKWVFKVPEDSRCSDQIAVSIRNAVARNSGNDFYVDNIILKEVEDQDIPPIDCYDPTTTTIVANDDFGTYVNDTSNNLVMLSGVTVLDFIKNDINNGNLITDYNSIKFVQLDQNENFRLNLDGSVSVLENLADGQYIINYLICNSVECSRAKVFVTVGDDVEIVPDIDGDGIPDNIDLDNDNDGILDIDEGIGGSCISGLNGDLNEEVWSFNGFDVTVDTGSQYSPTQYEPNSPIEAVRGSEISYSFSEIAKNVSFKISELNEGEVIKVRFKNNGKIVPINSYNLIKSSSSITTSISQGELTLRALQGGNEENIIVKSGFDFIDRIELVFTTETPPFIGDNVIPTAVYDFEGLCYGPDLDTDGDGIPDYLDTDSDGDGCPDALEAAVRGGKIIIANLDSKGSIIGDVDNNGVPVLANGGNGVGSSKDVAISVCKTLAHCTNSATSLGAFEESVVGISTFSTTANAFINGDSTTKQRESWPKLVKNAYLHLDTGNKGFIITNAIAEDIKEPLPGMLIYDTKDKCIKLRNGKEWKCIKSTCDITNNY